PEEPWRQQIDPGMDKDAAIEIRATDVGDRGRSKGRVLFGDDPWLVYDHEHPTPDVSMYPPMRPESGSEAADPANSYLRAQTCDLQVELSAVSERLPKPATAGAIDRVAFPGKPIRIEAVDSETCELAVTLTAQSGEGLASADVVVQPAYGG